MFPSDLYGVLQQLKIKGSYTEPLLRGLEEKEDKKKDKYFLIPIVVDNSERLTIGTATYSVTELHATIYAVRDSEKTVYRPHLTGTYTNIDSSETIKIRGFLNPDDSIDWIVYPAKDTNNKKHGKIKNDAPVEKQAASVVRSHMISHASPILFLLRKKQTQLMQEKMQAYTRTEYNLKLMTQNDTTPANDILSQVRNLIDLSQALAKISPNYTYWASLHAFYNQLATTYTAKNKQESLKKKNKAPKPATFFTPEPTTSTSLKAATNPIIENKQAINSLLTTLTSYHQITANTLTDDQARQQHQAIEQLESYLTNPNIPLSFTEQYNMLDAIITTKKYLATYCFSLLSNGETALVTPYLDVISHIPERLLRNYLDTDNATVYNFLLKNNLVSIYQTIQGEKLYTIAFNENRTQLIDCFLENGIHPWMMMSHVFRDLFSIEGISTQLLQEKLSSLKAIYEKISNHYDKLSAFMDNFILFLYAEQSVMNRTNLSFAALTTFICLLKVFRTISQLYSQEELERLNKPHQANTWLLFEQLIGFVDTSHEKIRMNSDYIIALAAPFSQMLQNISDRMSRLTPAQKESLKIQLSGYTQNPDDNDQKLREFFQLPILASLINNRFILKILGITDKALFHLIIKQLLTSFLTNFTNPSNDTYQVIERQYTNKQVMIDRIFYILATPTEDAFQTIFMQLLPTQRDWNQFIDLVKTNWSLLSQSFIDYSTPEQTWSAVNILSLTPFANMPVSSLGMFSGTLAPTIRPTNEQNLTPALNQWQPTNRK